MIGTIVDMHVHTVRGAADSSLTPDQLIEEAGRIGLTGVNISEHDRVWEAHLVEEFRERSGLFVSRGMEVSTDMGHMIVVGLERYVPGIRRAAELRRVLDEVGGFMIVAHPFRHFFDPIHFRRGERLSFDAGCRIFRNRVRGRAAESGTHAGAAAGAAVPGGTGAGGGGAAAV